MSTPAAAAGATPASSNVFARFVGVITAPRRTFEGVAAVPKWFGILALTTVIMGVFAALPMTNAAGRQAALDKQVQSMESFGVHVDDAMYEKLEGRAGSMPYTTGLSFLVLGPLMAVIFAGILFAVFNAGMGGEASFKQVFAVVAHAGAVSALSLAFSGVVNYFRHEMGSVANLGALLPMVSDKSFVGQLLGMVDVFTIWWVVVLAIGLAVLYRRRTQPIAVSLLGLYGVIAIVVALIKSRAGGA